MAEFPAGQERLLKQIVSTYRCQKCRRSFEHDHVRVAARHEKLWIVSVRCGRCRTQQTFWVTLKDRGDELSEFRDLTAAEEEQFSQMQAVTCDEVLDMHEFLSDFDGDFRALFSRR
jgi:hypothetical protein